MKEFIQSISRETESEAVNLATLRKDNLGTTLIPVHAERNWCYVQFSNFRNLSFQTKHIERFQCKSLTLFPDRSRVGNTSACSAA